MNPWMILGFVLAVGAAAGGGYYKGNSAGKAEVEQAWDKEKAEQFAAYAKGQEEARLREQELQAAADRLRRDRDAEVRNLNARVVGLSNSLQHREARPEGGSVSGSAGNGSTAAGCTGERLYRPDAEFLLREAAAGQQCQAFLRECRAAYDSAVKLTKEK
jgi:hypothetical protein